MNGPIAQLVALTCHGNAYLRNPGAPVGFFPGNSTCRFCDRVAFAETRRSFLFGKSRETPIAATPDAWFAHLREGHALGLRMLRQSTHRPLFTDRMTAGLVGGGGRWMLAVRHDANTRYFEADWQVWNREAPEQRIWRVVYRVAGSRSAPPPGDRPLEEVHDELHTALARIHAFAAAHDCRPFTDSFGRALESLDHPEARHGYHADLGGGASLSAKAGTQGLDDRGETPWIPACAGMTN
jgi:hypothetical protein